MEFEGGKISFLLRFSKFTPIFLLNYYLPITKLSFKNYFFGFFSQLPWFIIECFLGHLCENTRNIFEGNFICID